MLRRQVGQGAEAARILDVPQRQGQLELDASLVGSIENRIKEATGRQIETTSKVDPDIIGGLVLRVGNKVLDASIHGRLERLRRQIARAA